jgi:hypothetical protein
VGVDLGMGVVKMWHRWLVVMGVIAVGLLPLRNALGAADPGSAYLAAGQTVQGVPDTASSPDLPVDRATMAIGLARALAGSDEAVPARPLRPSFTDVPETHWAYKYIEYVKSLGVITGYADGAYQPGGAVDRGQMAVFLARALAAPAGELALSRYLPPSPQTFPDIGPDFWGYRHIEYLAEPTRGIAQGFPDGRFHPEAICTRGELTAFLARAFPSRHTDTGGETAATGTPPPDQTAPKAGQEEAPPKPK